MVSSLYKTSLGKKVHFLLTQNDIASYCPLTICTRKWSDRVKKVQIPLFSSYVFVCVNEQERSKVRMIDGVINFVYWNGKPAIIKPIEIETIRRFLNEFEEVEAIPLEGIRKGERVQLKSGIFVGRHGVIINIENKFAEIEIESIGYKLRAKIDIHQLEVLTSSNLGRKI